MRDPRQPVKRLEPSVLRKTSICLIVLLAVIAAASWRAATSSGPHLPLWALGTTIAVVLLWLNLPPRSTGRTLLLGPAILTTLSVLSLIALSSGLASFLAWSEVKLIGHGYRGAWPYPDETDRIYAQMRQGQFILGRQYGGLIGSAPRPHAAFRFGLYSSVPNPGSLWRWRLLRMTGFETVMGSYFDDGSGPMARANGSNILSDRISVPFWFPTLLLGAVPFWMLVVRPLRRRRVRAGLCPKCGYNLTGLTVPRCPECGIAVPLAASASA